MNRPHLLIAGSAAALALGLAGCSAPATTTGGATTAPTTAPAATTAAPASTASGAATSKAATTAASKPATPAASASGAAGDAGAGPKDGKSLQLNKTVEDAELGEKATVIKVVRGLKGPDAAMADREFVVALVEVDATAAKYSTSMDSSSFTWGITGKDYSGQAAASTAVKDWLKTNGMTPLESVSKGKKATGWVAGYLSPKDSPDAYIALRRPALKDNSGKEFPKQEWPVKLA